MNRRRLAPAIRVRQEVQKRMERYAPMPAWNGMESLLPLLDDHARAQVLRGENLVEHLRNAGASRFPSIPTNNVERPSDHVTVLAHAADLLGGSWRVFDHALELGSRPPEWRRHPVSQMHTPYRHFSMVRYVGKELGGDVKYIWELSRHAELLRMAQAYYLSGDERYATRVVTLLDDWMVHNPPAMGINWVSALEIAFRSIAWCWIWKLTNASAAWTNDLTGRFLWTLAHAARYLHRYDSIHHSPNTHLTGEALGLLYIGEVFPELRNAKKWRHQGIDILVSEVPHQFLPSGLHYERATGYHRYNVEFYLHALAIAKASHEDWGNTFVEPLRRALMVSATLQRPDGDWPVLGDEDGGAAVRLWTSASRNQMPLMLLGHTLLKGAEGADGVAAAPPAHIDAADNSLTWWFGLIPPPTLTPSAIAAEPVRAASCDGYFVARDRIGTNEWFCLVDAGPHGGRATGHAHTDVGHVELCVGETPVLSDPGCAIYASDAERRDWYRSLSAHACLVVDGNQLATTRGVFGWDHVAPTPFVEVMNQPAHWTCRLQYPVTADGSVVHERQVILIRGHGVIIVDYVKGTGTHDLRWHWPTGVQLQQSAMDAQARSVTISNTVMRWESSASTRVDFTSQPQSRTYGHEKSCTSIEVHASDVQLPIMHVTTLLNLGAPAPTVHFEVADVRVEFDAGVVLRVQPDRLPTLGDRLPLVQQPVSVGAA